MSSPVLFSLTAPQVDYLKALRINRAAWLAFDKRIGRALATAGLVAFSGGRPYLTVAGVHAARLATVLSKASHIGR